MLRIVLREMEQRVSQALAKLCPWMLPSEHLPCIPQAQNGPASGKRVEWKTEEQQRKQKTECAKERTYHCTSQLVAAATAG